MHRHSCQTLRSNLPCVHSEQACACLKHGTSGQAQNLQTFVTHYVQVCDAMELVPVERLQRARDVAAQFAKAMASAQEDGGKVSISAQEALALLKKLQGALEPEDSGAQGSADAAGVAATDVKGPSSFECVVCMGQCCSDCLHVSCMHVE